MDQPVYTIEQVLELADRYEACGFGNTSSGRFLRSIATSGQMPRGGGVSWLNDLMMKGAPEKVLAEAAEIESIAAKSHRKDTASTLLELAARIRSGRGLTENQKKLVDVLVQQVLEAKADMDLTPRQQELVDGLRTNKRQGSFYYWGSRPSISNRLDTIFKRWDDERLISPDDWEYMRENFKSTVAEFEDDRHPIGSLRWLKDGEAITIMSLPYLSDRYVMIDVVGATKSGFRHHVMRDIRKRKVVRQG